MSERIAVEGTTTYRLARLLEVAKLREAALHLEVNRIGREYAVLGSERDQLQEALRTVRHLVVAVSCCPGCFKCKKSAELYLPIIDEYRAASTSALAERDRNATACDPEILSGTPCLYGTRIPMTMLAAEVKQDGAAAVIADRHLPCTAECLETAVARFAEWLKDHDRGIERRTAERCAVLSDGASHKAILREFNLEPKTEGV